MNAHLFGYSEGEGYGALLELLPKLRERYFAPESE